MSQKDLVINYIKNEPRFRERTNKNRGIANLLMKEHPSLVNVNPKVLADIVGEVLTMDRAWRKFLADNEEYRGSDYGEKERLEQEAQIELGYTQ